MSDAYEALAPAMIGAHVATRKPRLKDGMAFMAAIEGKDSMTAQLSASRDLLIGMGFPADLVDDLDVDAVVEYSTRFFTAAFQRPPATNGSIP
jgi:hypothetical protein